MHMFCQSCGKEISPLSRFCGSCGNTTSNVSQQQTPQDHSVNVNGTYKKLVLIGGIFGIIITPIVSVSMSLLFAIGSAFSSGGGLDTDTNVGLMWMSIITSIVISTIGILVAYLGKNLKTVGIILIIFGIIEMIGTVFLSGLITWLLFIIAGILAIKQSQK